MASEYPKPPYPSQKQPMPGSTQKMDPRPDHGETSYRGSGRLQERTRRWACEGFLARFTPMHLEINQSLVGNRSSK